jgi:hypothetical protein
MTDLSGKISAIIIIGSLLFAFGAGLRCNYIEMKLMQENTVLWDRIIEFQRDPECDNCRNK